MDYQQHQARFIQTNKINNISPLKHSLRDQEGSYTRPPIKIVMHIVTPPCLGITTEDHVSWPAMETMI
jgi:hypothetical protein